MYRGGEMDQAVASAWEEPEALRTTACPVPVTHPGESRARTPDGGHGDLIQDTSRSLPELRAS